MQRYDLELFADYHQFYLQDELADGDLSSAWDEEATTRMLAATPGVVGIGTVRNTDVPVRIEILTSEPSSDFASFDQVVECSLDLASGRLVAAGCTDYFPDAQRIDLPAGIYRVRVSYANLNSQSPEALSGEDSYLVQLWLAPSVTVSTLKERAV